MAKRYVILDVVEGTYISPWLPAWKFTSRFEAERTINWIVSQTPDWLNRCEVVEIDV